MFFLESGVRVCSKISFYTTYITQEWKTQQIPPLLPLKSNSLAIVLYYTWNTIASHLRGLPELRFPLTSPKHDTRAPQTLASIRDSTSV